MKNIRLTPRSTFFAMLTAVAASVPAINAATAQVAAPVATAEPTPRMEIVRALEQPKTLRKL
ncbi:MAG: hypothetical protein WCL04_10860, partial [Verrucomicrobiota bacterium]